MIKKKKLIRITTVPISLEKLLENQLTYMNDYYEVIAVSSDKDRLVKFGKENKVKVKHIEMTRVISPIKDLISLLKMYRFLRKEKPLIVHSHTPKAGTIGMLAAKLAGVPHRLHTVAGLPLIEATGLKRKVLNFVEKITYKCATKVYPNSFGLEKIIRNLKFCKDDKLKVIGQGSSNGIATVFFKKDNISEEENSILRSNLGIKEDDFVYIFVGRIVSDKGINELIEAFSKLAENKKDIKLILVGPKEEELDALKSSTLRKINDLQSIISVGYQQDVRPYFAISNCLVFPSYREGFPNVVLQACAMEIPSIVSNINGCNEIIEDQHNGLIVQAKDEDSLLKAMSKILDNNLYLSLKGNTRKTIVEKYDQNFVWNCLLEEYKNIY